MTLKLRPYQEECLSKISERLNSGIHRQLVALPTGSGKTVVFGHLIEQTKHKTLVIAHTCELLEQAKEKIEMICPSLKVGLVNATHKEFDSPVVVSSIQSARKPENLKQLQQQGFSLMVYDECHHAASDSARMVIECLGFGKGTDRLLTGFTATPLRMDGKGLGEDFDEIVFSKTIKSMIKEGYLCQPRGIKVSSDLDLSAVKTESGDYIATSLSDVMNTDALNDLVAKTYVEKALGRKAICFGVSISHAENLAKWFKTYGVKAETINGNMPKDERDGILRLFKDGEIDVITNCQVLSEGYDDASISCVIMARPTQSRGLYLQMAGRGLRLFPNKKDCLILDFGDKHHTLRCTAVLEEDSELTESKECQKNDRMVSLAHTLPPTINQKLKAAIMEYDLLSDSFDWQKDFADSYQLKGVGSKTLKIVQSAPDRFDVIFIDGNNLQTITKGLSFEYAFATAESYAKENRSQFIVSDLDASWRSRPISDKQKALFRSYGYRAGIDDLTRGQAATIISSGILNRKAL